MDLIFMLTRQDRTVPDCLDVLDQLRPLGLRHIGFKDVGVDAATLRSLIERIRDAGATSWMEIVSTDSEAMLESARVGAAIGVDRLLGGTEVDGVLPLLRGGATRYLPFPGLPSGHPTMLGGDVALVERHCRAFVQAGCAGADLLAYRATEADPLALVAAARRGLGHDGVLVVAGSIASARQVAAIARAGADAFTVGSAAFEGTYRPGVGGLVAQVSEILEDATRASADMA